MYDARKTEQLISPWQQNVVALVNREDEGEG